MYSAGWSLFNQDVTDQLTQMFGQDLPSLRYLPLRISNTTYKYAGYWPDGRVEWKNYAGSGEEPCKNEKHFTDDDWTKNRHIHIDGNTFQPGDLKDDDRPEFTICEYLGNNLVPGKRYLSVNDRTPNTKQLVGDRNFAMNAEFSAYPWLAVLPSTVKVWFSIDFGIRHAIRMFRWQGGNWNYPLVFHVTDLEPVQGASIEDVIGQYLLCGIHPQPLGYHVMWYGDIHGVTCPCFVVGRFAVITHQHDTQIIQLGELAAYGFPTT